MQIILKLALSCDIFSKLTHSRTFSYSRNCIDRKHADVLVPHLRIIIRR